ncbi:multidrug resistance protein 1-like [Platysternon megacephalum]|uniref:Multidrug resistance protein 1-like n=1 Tax=Platysternon megacephalum TaxID=55544 RepID=A0A4D9EJ02_9SAUR|nr:multidrug resistance protein 1-like [Platysternon megacephalum]
MRLDNCGELHAYLSPTVLISLPSAPKAGVKSRLQHLASGQWLNMALNLVYISCAWTKEAGPGWWPIGNVLHCGKSEFILSLGVILLIQAGTGIAAKAWYFT